MENNYKDNAKVFKALCDENRLRILELLQTGEKCACVLLDDLDIVQPTLSHHMKILCDSNIVVGRKDGKWTHYSISPEGAAAAQTLLKSLLTVTGESGCRGAPQCEYYGNSFRIKSSACVGSMTKSAACSPPLG